MDSLILLCVEKQFGQRMHGKIAFSDISSMRMRLFNLAEVAYMLLKGRQQDIFLHKDSPQESLIGNNCM